jgi:farnesyl-diphosphate farnesyltransferase
LLHEFPRLLNVLRTFPGTVVRSICQALNSTIDGMTFFIDAATGSPDQIRLQTVHELHQYCYAVAGIVGELLTDIFVFHHPPGLAIHRELRPLSAGFGEFLQLTNILKDADGDAASGRVFIPDGTSRESVFQLAYTARQDALQYIRLLERTEFPRDVLHFCQFICILADGSLNRLQSSGAGRKLSREEVMQLLSAVETETAVWPV